MIVLFRIACAATLLLGAVSCGKKPESEAPAAPPPPAARVSVADAAAEAPPPPGAEAPPAPGEEAPPPPAEGGQNFEADRQRLTQALREHIKTKGKWPRNVDELVTAGLIAEVPHPPPGKRWNFDTRKNEVIIDGYPVGL